MIFFQRHLPGGLLGGLALEKVVILSKVPIRPAKLALALLLIVYVSIHV
jgi:hypothetical protein